MDDVLVPQIDGKVDANASVVLILVVVEDVLVHATAGQYIIMDTSVLILVVVEDVLVHIPLDQNSNCATGS